jgi:hypothetical protein
MSLPGLVFSPDLPLWILAAAAIAGLLICALGWRRRGPKGLWRLIPTAVLILALTDPRLTREQTSALNDVAIIMVDDSASMMIGGRPAQSAAALDGLEANAKQLTGLDVRVEHFRPLPGRDEGTKLFGALDQALGDVPVGRLAGSILITDGEINDVPTQPDFHAPIHVLLVGHKNERDRKLVIEQAPAFEIVGKTANLSFRVEDPGQTGDVAVTMRRDGGKPTVFFAALNQPTNIDVPIEHAGANVIELSAAAAPDELTLLNNRTALVINGIRDRLRVLLISGEPHAGERTWRNLLKADPSVDLVHFTILRPPEKMDATPVRDLALIAFPVRELFEDKLSKFDLIILDRYRRRVVLPAQYYANIADYVRNGGALLTAVGPEFGGDDSIYDSALSDILPAAPAGRDFEGEFTPQITAVGRRHPVTSGLPGEGDPPSWGPWARAIGAQTKASAATLMAAPNGQPLLVLDHVDKGRVAELLSDTVWLWSRNYLGGGPQAELLRRLAHWLMKEPELEENQLTAQIADGTLQIERRSLAPDDSPITVTAPDGTERQVNLTDAGGGRAGARIAIDQPGLWRVADDIHVALAASGALNPIEMANLRATPDKLMPVVKATGGGIAWLEDGLPDLRRVESGERASGSSWFGLRTNHDHVVTALTDTPLIPAPLLLLLGFGGLALAWWREGR